MAHQAIFTHHDLDGLVSALLARLVLPSADVFFCDYGALVELVEARIDRYEVLWFTDLSISDQSLFRLLRESEADVYWFDHHASSAGQDWMVECRIDTSGEKCAADVVRAYVEEQGLTIPLPLQTLCDYAHDQDLWVRRLPEAQTFNDILGHMGVWDLFQLLEADLSRVYHWTPEMRAASEATAGERRRSVELAELSSVYAELPDGCRVRAACCWGSTSEVADEIGAPDTLVALIDLRAIGRGGTKCSLRTQSDTIRADRVAEQLGGGGHPKAAGAPLDPSVLQSLSRELLRQVVAAIGDGGGET